MTSYSKTTKMTLNWEWTLALKESEPIAILQYF